MTDSAALYERAVRLGRLIPKEIVVSRKVEAPPVKKRDVMVLKAPYRFRREYPLAIDILSVVADFYEITINDLKSARRSIHICLPRHICCFLMKDLTLLSYPQMGASLGRRDHTTIIHGVQKITKMIFEEDRIADEIELLKIKILELMQARNPAYRQDEHIETA